MTSDLDRFAASIPALTMLASEITATHTPDLLTPQQKRMLPKHEYVPANLGHSNTACKWCAGTPQENAALGEEDFCKKRFTHLKVD